VKGPGSWAAKKPAKCVYPIRHSAESISEGLAENETSEKSQSKSIPTMSEIKSTIVQQIIQTAMMTGLLTAAQEHELNVKVFQEDCSEADLFLLRRLHRCLRQGSIRRIPALHNTIAVGRFGLPLRPLPDRAEEAQLQPAGLSVVRNPKVG